jgi:hypothetical protein
LKNDIRARTTPKPKNEETRTLTLFVGLNEGKDSSARFGTEGMMKEQLRLDIMRVLTVREAMDPQNTILPNWSKGWMI